MRLATDDGSWEVTTEGGRYFVTDFDAAGRPVRSSPATTRDIAQFALRGGWSDGEDED